MFARLLAVVSLAALAIAAPSASESKRQLPQASVVTKCTVPNTVALTFDDGPWVYAYDVSKLLVAAGAKGTFFFNGANFECIYSANNIKRVKYVYDKGHQVASHTWSHANLTTLTWDQIHDEMWKVEQAISRITGAYPAFVRPPFGETNVLVRQAAAARGQTIANWDFDTGDSLGQTVAQQKARIDQVAAQRPSTILSLAHEVHDTSVFQVLPYAIQKFQAAGYRLVTLAECLGVPAYHSVAPPPTVDPSWSCPQPAAAPALARVTE